MVIRNVKKKTGNNNKNNFTGHVKKLKKIYINGNKNFALLC